MSPYPFVGREYELNRLNLLLNKRSASLVVVKGRRRIGKSRLVEEFASGKRFLRFSGIPPVEGTSAQTQREIFAEQLSDQLGLPGIKGDNWTDLFKILATQTKQGRVIVLLDEISWMGSKDPTFLGKLKNIWDIELNKNPELILILCGSVSTWIEKNIIKSTGFFGRISAYITLEELPLTDCNRFLDTISFRGSVYEKFKLLSVTGGVPWYLEQIQPELNANANIQHLCFSKDGVLLREFDRIFHDLFSVRSKLYQTIVELIADGPINFVDLCRKLDYAKSGVLSQYLEDLMQAGFISRDYTWLLKNGKASRLSHYRLSDNYLRFYLKYILPKLQSIISQSYDDISLSSLPQWDTIMGLQFENLILSNRKTIHQALKLRSEDMVAGNPFFQKKTSTQAGCQIDYLIQTRYNTLFACEIKFSRHEIGNSIIQEMQEKLAKIKLPRGFSVWPVLIHVNGVHETVEDSGYFTEIIDFAQFLGNG